MLLLLLEVVNLCLSLKFNGYNSTFVKNEENQPLCLNGTYAFKEQEIKLEHHTYPSYKIPSLRHFEQWIVKDLHGNLLAISNIR